MAFVPQFFAAHDFSNGRAAIVIGDTRENHFYVDNHSRLLVNQQFGATPGFKKNMTRVDIGEFSAGKFGFVDRKGRLIVLPQFDVVQDFSDGLAAVRMGDERTGKFGFIDTEGKMVIGFQFDAVNRFADGLAAVRFGDNLTGKWGATCIPFDG